MPKQTVVTAGGSLFNTVLDYAAENNPSLITEAECAQGLAAVFADADLVDSCMCLFENNLNVSLAAKKLYMHRNTLIYRIKKIKRLTGLDVTAFSDAVSFIIYYRGYLRVNGSK